MMSKSKLEACLKHIKEAKAALGSAKVHAEEESLWDTLTELEEDLQGLINDVKGDLAEATK